MGDDPAEPKSDRLLTKLEGGGWGPEDWSPDDSKILLKEQISLNEAYLWLVDTKTAKKRRLCRMAQARRRDCVR